MFNEKYVDIVCKFPNVQLIQSLFLYCDDT